MKRAKNIIGRIIVMIIMLCLFTETLSPMESTLAADDLEVYVGDIKHPDFSPVIGLTFSTHLVAVFNKKTNEATFYLNRVVTEDDGWEKRAVWLGVLDEAQSRISKYGNNSVTLKGTYTMTKKDITGLTQNINMETVKSTSGGSYYFGEDFMLSGSAYTYSGGAIQNRPIYITFEIENKEGKKSHFDIPVGRGSKADIPKLRVFTMKKDNFSFKNTASSFVSPKNQKSENWNIFRHNDYNSSQLGFYIDDNAYNKLTKDMNLLEKAAVNNMMGKSVNNGLCAGISALSGVIFQGSESLKFFTSKATTYKAEAPKNNSKLMSSLVYYHIRTNLLNKCDRVKSIKKFLELKSSTDASTLVKKLNAELPNPVLLCFTYKNSKGGTGRHAALAFAITEADGEYDRCISLCDPNDQKIALSLYVNTKTGKYEAEEYDDFTIVGMYTMKDISGTEPLPYKFAENLLLIDAKGDATITNGSSKLVIKDGKITSNKGFEAVSFGIDENSAKTSQIIINNYNKKKSLVVSAKSSDAAVSIQKSNELVTATGKKSVKVTVGTDGTVTAKTGNKKADGTLDVISNKTKTSKPGLSVKADGGTIKIKPTSNGGEVTAPGCKNAEIIASGGSDCTKKSGVDARNKVKINTENGSIKIDASDKSQDPTPTPTSTPTPTPTPETTDNSGNKTDNSKTIKWPDYTDIRIKSYVPSDWAAVKSNKALSTRDYVPGIYLREDGKSILYLYYSIKSPYLPYEIYTVSNDDKKEFIKPTTDEVIYKAEWRSEPDMEPQFKMLSGKAVDSGLYLAIKQETETTISVLDDSGNLNLFAKLEEYENPFGTYNRIYKFE